MFQRRRARILLAVSVVVALVLITLDFRSDADGDDLASQLRRGAGIVVGPVQDGLATLVRPLASAASGVGELFDLRGENARLRAQLARTEERRLSYDDVVRENDDLREQLGFRNRNELDTVTAQIIAQGASNFEWTATLDVGTDDGVEADMPVINGEGLVGRVIATTPSTSSVLLTIDPNFGAAVRVAETGVVGSLAGDGNEPLIFEPLITDVDIEVGQELVSSSYLGGTYISGIPIGVVTRADVEEGQLTRTVDVLPFVDFSTLGLVSVVLTDPVEEPEPIELDPSPEFTAPPVDPQRPADDVPAIPSPNPTSEPDPTSDATSDPTSEPSPSPTTTPEPTPGATAVARPDAAGPT